MKVQETIEHKVMAALNPQFLRVENESRFHNVPVDSESHFKVTVVAEEFVGLSLLQRHRNINKLLADELAGQIHALTIHVYTPEEWRRRGREEPASPPCLGGGGAESDSAVR